MKHFVVIFFSLFLTSCISFHLKGYDVRKTADNMNNHIGEQKKKLSDSYKEHVRFYRALQKSGLRKKQAPMPTLLKQTLEMKALAVQANGIMKKIRLKTTRMRQIADGKKRISDTDPEYKEINELKEGIEELIVELESVAKKYNRASEEFSTTARENDLYLLRSDQLRAKAEEFETKLLEVGRKVKADLKKARSKAKTAGQKNVVNEMSELSREILISGRGIQELIDKLLLRLGDEDVAVGPHSDPKVTVKHIEEKMLEMKTLADEYNELARTL